MFTLPRRHHLFEASELPAWLRDRFDADTRTQQARLHTIGRFRVWALEFRGFRRSHSGIPGEAYGSESVEFSGLGETWLWFAAKAGPC